MPNKPLNWKFRYMLPRNNWRKNYKEDKISKEKSYISSCAALITSQGNVLQRLLSVNEIHVPKCGKALKWSVYAERPFSTNFKVNSRSELNSGIVIQIIFYMVNQQRFEVKKLSDIRQKIIWGFQMSFIFISYALFYKLNRREYFYTPILSLFNFLINTQVLNIM